MAEQYGFVTELTQDNFEEETSTPDTLIVVDFWAQWCGPCRMLSPLVEELSEEMPDVKFCKVNVDSEPELAREFNVSSIPMLAFIKNGTVTDISIGFVPKEQLTEKINENK